MAAITFTSSAPSVSRKFTGFTHVVKAEQFASSSSQQKKTSVFLSAPAEYSGAQFYKQSRNSFATAVSAVEEEVGGFERPAEDPSQGNRLYVGNLPFNVDSESLARLFSESGEVDQVDVIYDRDTGRSRGFAFVSMASHDDAVNAIEQFDGKDLAGRPLKVTFPMPRGERAPRTQRAVSAGGGGGSPGAGNKLYVGNLSWGFDDYGLADLFSEFGEVVEAKVVMDRDTGKSRGFGFVTFSSPEQGNSAVAQLDGAEIDGRTIRVSVAQDRPRTGF